MAELTSKFNRQDIETLIKAIGDWEMLGDQEYRMMLAIKNAPLPPEDSEAYEVWSHIKEQFQLRERHIVSEREQRQEEAVFLKAKLMLTRREMGISDLFEMAAESVPQVVTPKPCAKTKPCSGTIAGKPEKPSDLELAEFFIKDLGVWDHYQKFLAEKKTADA